MNRSKQYSSAMCPATSSACSLTVAEHVAIIVISILIVFAHVKCSVFMLKSKGVYSIGLHSLDIRDKSLISNRGNGGKNFQNVLGETVLAGRTVQVLNYIKIRWLSAALRNSLLRGFRRCRVAFNTIASCAKNILIAPGTMWPVFKKRNLFRKRFQRRQKTFRPNRMHNF